MSARGKCGLFLHLPLRQGNAARCRKGIGRQLLQVYSKVASKLRACCRLRSIMFKRGAAWQFALASVRVSIFTFPRPAAGENCRPSARFPAVRASIAFVSPRPRKHGTCVPASMAYGYPCRACKGFCRPCTLCRQQLPVCSLCLLESVEH